MSCGPSASCCRRSAADWGREDESRDCVGCSPCSSFATEPWQRNWASQEQKTWQWNLAVDLVWEEGLRVKNSPTSPPPLSLLKIPKIQ
jgi:hypothetical protein